MSGTCEAKKLVHPKDLPIYDTVQDAPAPVPKPEEPSAALEAVKTVRLAIGDGIKQASACSLTIQIYSTKHLN